MTFFSDKKPGLAGLLPFQLSGFARKNSTARGKAESVSDDAIAQDSLNGLHHRLQIPVLVKTPDQIEGDKAREYGLYMARQDRWEEQADQIKAHDKARLTTPSGVPLAELMAYGARSDVVRAAEHSLLHGKPAEDSDFFSGIEALESVLFDAPDCYATA